MEMAKGAAHKAAAVGKEGFKSTKDATGAGTLPAYYMHLHFM